MTGSAEEPPDAATPTLAGPVRVVLLVGAALSLVGAVTVGGLGASGGGSLAAAMLGVAFTCGLAGLTGLIGVVRAELAGEPAPRRHIAVGIGLLLLAPVVLMLAAGAAAAR